MTNAELQKIRRLLEAQVDSHYALGIATAITAAAAPTAIAVGTNGGDVAAEAIPEADCRLEQAVGVVTAVAAGAVQIEWCVSMTAAPPYIRVTPVIPTTINLDPAGATGTITAVLSAGGIPYRRFTGLGAAGNLWVVARTTAGTCTLQPYLVFTAKTPLPIP